MESEPLKNRKLELFTGVFIILLILTSGPILVSASDVFDHSWNDPHFALVVDVNQLNDKSFHLVKDLTPDFGEPTPTTDANPLVNNNFFFSYINNSGMEVGYLALDPQQGK